MRTALLAEKQTNCTEEDVKHPCLPEQINVLLGIPISSLQPMAEPDNGMGRVKKKNADTVENIGKAEQGAENTIEAIGDKRSHN